jgi:hypothetical protein
MTHIFRQQPNDASAGPPSGRGGGEMSAYHFYILASGCFACYVLGVMHAKGHTGWSNWSMAVLIGAAWPASIIYGAYLVHIEPKGDGHDQAAD